MSDTCHLPIHNGVRVEYREPISTSGPLEGPVIPQDGDGVDEGRPFASAG